MAMRPLYNSSPPLYDKARRSPVASQAIFSMPWLHEITGSCEREKENKRQENNF